MDKWPKPSYLIQKLYLIWIIMKFLKPFTNRKERLFTKQEV